MNCVKVRQTTQTGCSLKLYEGMTKGVYKNPTESVRDLILWFRYNNFPRSVSDEREFAEELRKRGYFQTSINNYSKALKSWL